MSFGIKLHTWGDFACFTRAEMKAGRVSYDLITPSAARGILEAIYWKPEIRWVIDKIHLINPPKFTSIRRNEVGKKASTQDTNPAAPRHQFQHFSFSEFQFYPKMPLYSKSSN